MQNKYILSEAAEKDISLIFDYTQEKFGFSQAIGYLKDMEEFLFTLVKNPEIGKERNEIKSDLRGILFKEHIIFYTRVHTKVRIVRVLHGGMDLPDHF